MPNGSAELAKICLKCYKKEDDKVVSRQLQRHKARENAKHGKQNVQTALNNLLWKIAMNNGGVISMSRYELDQIPPNAALASNYDSKTNHFMVKAILRPSQDGLAKGAGG